MAGESIDRAAQEAAVVDLLATWGATALPDVVELFEVLATFRQRGSLDYLRQLLDASEVALDAELRTQLQELLEASRTVGGAGAEFDRRAAPVLENARGALELQARTKRDAVGERLGPWTPALETDDLREILDRLCHGEPAHDIEGHLLDIRQLDQASELLDRATSRIEQEVTSSLQPHDGSPLDPDLGRSVRTALDSGDPVRMVQAWSTLSRSRSGRLSTEEAEALEAARQRLAEACARARQTAEDSGPLLSASHRDLLLAAARSGAASLQHQSGPGGIADGSAWGQALARSERVLAVMLEELSAAGETGRRRRLLSAQALLAQWRSLAAGLDQPATAADHLEQTLLDGVPAGGTAFYEALSRGSESIRSLRQASADHVERAEARVQRVAQALAAELEESAGFLPTTRVVQSRLLVEGVAAAVATKAPGNLESLATAMESETVELRRLAAGNRERRVSVATSERGAAREDCENLIAVVPSSTAKRLQGLLGRLERAEATEVQAAHRDFEAVAAEARNRIRLDAARTLHRAEKSLARRGGKGAPPAGADADSTATMVQALRDALDGDDVESMAGGCREVEQALKTRVLWSRPLVRVAVAAAGVLLLVSLLLAWQWYTNRTREYRLVLSGSPVSSESITISLVRDGRIAEQGTYDPARPAVVRLSPGEYEIYVNGRYTGRVVRVPADPHDVTDIPFP